MRLQRHSIALVLVVCLAFILGRVGASHHLVRFDELMSGANGNSRIQFLELVMAAAGENCWGPQVAFPATLGSDADDDDCVTGTNETRSRAMLVFFDAQDREVGRFKFPENPPGGANRRVLIATAEFAALSGAPTPDFVMPPLMSAVNGKVCFRSNAENANAGSVNVCVSYGAFTGNTEGAGATAAALPIVNTVSLQRQPGTTDNVNAFFAATPQPTPANSANETFVLFVAPPSAQGATLFTSEAFMGNGRTCSTCHVPALHGGLTPENVQARFASVSATFDPLFIAESAATGFDFNLNTLTIAARPQHQSGSDFQNPSGGDLRGILTSTGGGRAKVLSKVAANVYRIYGGGVPALSGIVTDAFGNQATVVSVTLGDLHALESPVRMRSSRAPNFPQGRALILENIDGFANPPVFRRSPNLVNVAHTAPFGFNGDIGDLQTFSVGAGVQHFPRTLARSATSSPGSNPDFRAVSADELRMLELFMQSFEFPGGTDVRRFDLARFVRFPEQQRGRDLFFGNVAKCSRCHGGNVLATTTVVVQGKPAGVNASFNTGVANQPINGPLVDNLPCEPTLGACNSREFSTPQLFDVRNLAPYFHDASAPTLTAAVQFYDTPAFNNSPAGRAVGGINLSNQAVNDLTAFLAGLSNLSISAIANRTTVQNTPTAPIGFGLNDIDTLPANLTVSARSSNPSLVSPANIVFNGTGVNRSVVVTPTGGVGNATITIVASDGVNRAEESFVLTVMANTAPTISAIADQTTSEDQSTIPIAFTIGDAETPSAALTVTGTSSNTTVVPNSGIVFSGTGATRAVRITPATNQSGVATITVSVTDGAVSTASSSFTIAVVAVNDAPTISSIADQVIEQGRATSALAFTVNDVESSAATLTIAAASSNPTLVSLAGIVLAGSGATRTIAVTPDPSQSGSSLVTVTVSDADGGASHTSFNVVVGSVPSALTATADGSLVQLSWTPPPSSVAVTGYQVEAGASPGATATSVATGSTAPAFALNVPTAGTWHVRVRALTPAGLSGASNEVAVTTSAVPSRPRDLTVSVVGTTATFAWNPPFSGGVTNYVIEAGSQSGASNIATAPTGSTIPGLVLNTVPAGSYFVRVRAANGAGLSAASNEVIVTSPTSPTLPGPPAGLNGNVSGNAVALAWLPPATGGAAETYIIEAGTSPGSSNIASVPVGLRLSFSQSGLPNGRYFVRIRARNAAGISPPSNEITLNLGVDVAPPAPPTNLAAVVSGNAVTLTWNASASGASVTAYVIEAGSVPGGSNLATVAVGTSTVFVASGIPPGTYFIRVRALSATASSVSSNEVSVTVR